MKIVLFVPKNTPILKFCTTNDSYFVLDERALNPTENLWKHINCEPETIDIVYTKGLLERTNYIRSLFKRANYLLKVGGILKVEFLLSDNFYRVGQPIRPFGFLMYEYSVSISDYFDFVSQKVEGNVAYLEFKKKIKVLPPEDTLDCWSFGIISNGKRNDIIIESIKQIVSLNIPKFEIIICGPPPTDHMLDNVLIIDDDGLSTDLRPPTTAKKNKIIEHARYNNIVIMHDRFFFPIEWYSGFLEYGNYFEVVCNPIYEENKFGYRVLDWIHYGNSLLDFKNNRTLMLPYNKWSNDIYVDGGYMVAKRSVLLKNKYDERIKWGEGEDVHYSKQLYHNGVLITLNVKSYVFTKSLRNKSVNFIVYKYYARKLFGFIDRYFKIIMQQIIYVSKYKNFLNRRPNIHQW